MLDYKVDLSEFPPALHRIVKSWYQWQSVDLHRSGIDPELEAAAGEIAWRTRPPSMTSSDELRFMDDSEIIYYLVVENGEYFIDKKSRGSRARYWMFRRFEDAEKYMLFLISQMVRPGKYSDSPSFKWYREGLHPRVTLAEVDPENYPGRVSLTVDQEPIDRGWMTEHNAIAGSHVIVLSFNELDEALREGIPREWFSINVVPE
jgi:hypothetical protein